MGWLKVIWILFTLILLAFPIGFLLYLLYGWLKKVFFIMKKKFENIKALEKMREDLLRKSAGEYSLASEEDSSIQNTGTIKLEISSDDSKIEDQTKDGFTMLLGKKKNINSDDVTLTQVEYKNQDQDSKKNLNLEEKNLQEINKIIYQVEGLKNEGKIDEYEKKIIEGLSLDPHNLVLNKKLANLYFSRQEYKKALSLLKKIIEEEPDNHSSLWQVGEIYLNSQDYQTAELLIDKAIDLNAENPKYYMSMVEVYYSTKRIIQAVQTMEKVIKLRPENPKYLQLIAEFYDEMGDEDNAVKYYFRLLENDPSNFKAKKRLNQ